MPAKAVVIYLGFAYVGVGQIGYSEQFSVV